MPVFSQSDEKLVRLTLDGSLGSFEALVLRYQRAVHAVAVAEACSFDQPDDIVQEAFLQAFRDLAALREPRKFGAWLIAITRHVAIRFRAQEREKRLESEPTADAVQPVVEAEDFREYLWNRVRELPRELRETLFLYYYEGGSVGEVAKALGVSRSCVKKRLRRGRDQLRTTIWGELRHSIEERVPSKAQWAKRGKQLAFLVTTSIPVSFALRASGAQIPPSFCCEPSAVVGGVLQTSAVVGTCVMKKLTVSTLLALVIVLGLGGGVYLLQIQEDESGVSEVGRDPSTQDLLSPTRQDVLKPPPRIGVNVERRAVVGVSTEAPLLSEATLSGVVVNTDGEGVEGAVVRLLEQDEEFSGATYRFFRLGSSTERAQSEDSESVSGMLDIARAVTDATGRFEFRPKNSLGPFFLRADGPAGESSIQGGPFSPGDQGVRLELEPMLFLEGRVVDDASGLPLLAAVVRLRNGAVYLEAKTDATGTFLFGAVSTGTYALHVLHADYNAAQKMSVEIPQTSELTVRMSNSEEPGRVFGVVWDALTGSAIVGAEVVVEGAHATVTGPTGAFETGTPIKEGYSVGLQVRADGYGWATRRIEESDLPFEWNVGLRPAVSLSCKVVREGGLEVVAGAKVALEESQRHKKAYQRTNAEGSVEFNDIAAGSQVKLFAFHPRFGRSRELEVELRDSDSSVTIELEETLGTVVAEVRYPDDTPAVGAHVLVLDGLGSTERILELLQQTRVVGASLMTFGDFRIARTDETGTARFPGTFPGHCVVQALGPDYPLDDLQAFRRTGLGIGFSDALALDVIAEEEPSVCELVLWRPFALHGAVITAEGSAVENVTVRLLEKEDGGWCAAGPFCYSTAFGTYRFLGLDPLKEYALTVLPEEPGAPSRKERWKLVPEDRILEKAENEKFKGGTMFGSGKRKPPKSFAAFTPVPTSESTRETDKQVDIVVEFLKEQTNPGED